MRDPIVYVGYAVTSGSLGLSLFVRDFKQRLREESKTLVLEWIANWPADEKDMYEQDMGNVILCTVMIAFIDEPSTGLGMEIERALREHKRILCLHKRASAVSRLVAAAALDKPGQLSIRTYKHMADAVMIATKFIQNGTRVH